MPVKLGVGETAHLNKISQSELGVCLSLLSVPFFGGGAGKNCYSKSLYRVGVNVKHILQRRSFSYCALCGL